MATATIKLGPADHGRRMSREEYEAASGEEGYRYELIRGRVYVTAAPNMPHGHIVWWLNLRLFMYSQSHPGVIDYIHFQSRVFVPDPDDETIPEPDLAAYPNVPAVEGPRDLRWDDYSPVLVVEVVSDDDPGKDCERNVDLYLQVPSIREYWIIDPRKDSKCPSLRVYRRRGQRWQKPIDVPGGGTYTTKLLPDFELVLDVRR